MKKERIALGIFVLLAALCLVAYQFLPPKPADGTKEITVNVVHLAGEETSYTFTTQAEYLRQALEEQKLVSGSESEYGLWVQTVDGETANEANQEWWGYDVNGVRAEYGVDSQPVHDGDVFLFTLNVGW